MTAVAGRETNAQQVPSSASRAITAEGSMNIQRLRRAQRLARKARALSDKQKWDAANRIMARAIKGVG